MSPFIWLHVLSFFVDLGGHSNSLNVLIPHLVGLWVGWKEERSALNVLMPPVVDVPNSQPKNKTESKAQFFFT